MKISNHTACTAKPAGCHSLVSRTPLPKEVAALDLNRLKHKFTTTTDAVMTSVEWETAEPEYRQFLALKVFYPGLSLVPSKQVSKIWQVHILDTRAYREDCEKVYGRYLDHYPYFGIYGAEDELALQRLIAHTIELYEQHFGPYPKRSPAHVIYPDNGVRQEVTA